MMTTTQHTDRVDVHGVPQTPEHTACLLKAVAHCARIQIGAAFHQPPQTNQAARWRTAEIIESLSSGETVTLYRGIVTIPLQH